MVYQKTVKGRILTFVMCAVVALSVVWCSGFRSRADWDKNIISDWNWSTSSLNVFQSVSCPVDGVVETPVSLALHLGDARVSGNASIGFEFYLRVASTDPVAYKGSVYIKDVRVLLGGDVYYPAYSAYDGYYYFHFVADFTYVSTFDIQATLVRHSVPSANYVPLTTLSLITGSCAMVSASASGSSNVTDKVQQQLTQQQTEQQHQDAQAQKDAIDNQTKQQAEDAAKQLEEQKKQTAIAEEQKETTKGIFGKISSFFASFFENIINAVASMVLPDSDELMAFLDEVNTWFGDRLGFIYYPFDLAVQLVQAFAGGDANQEFTVPALTLNILGEQYAIWESFTVDLDAMGIFVYVRYFTSAMLCLGVGKLAVDKWDDWIGGKRS